MPTEQSQDVLIPRRYLTTAIPYVNAVPHIGFAPRRYRLTHLPASTVNRAGRYGFRLERTRTASRMCRQRKRRGSQL